MKVTIRKDAGTVSCPVIGQVSPRLNRCQFTLCYQLQRPAHLFPTVPGQDCVSGLVPDWVELHFPDAVMEKNKLRIVTTQDAEDIYRLYADSPSNKPEKAIEGIYKILDHEVFAIVKTRSNSIVRIFDDKEIAEYECKLMCDDYGEGTYEVRDVSKGGVD